MQTKQRSRTSNGRGWYYPDSAKQWQKDNREKIRQRNKIRKDAQILWYQELKKTLKCQKCSENHPACLVFHHRDPSTKKYEVSVLVQRISKRETILTEIAKCDVLCANCHAKHHYEDKQIFMHNLGKTKEVTVQ